MIRWERGKRGEGIELVLRFGGGDSGFSGVVPDLGVVRGGRGRRLAGIPSILLRWVEGKVQVLRLEERQKLG